MEKYEVNKISHSQSIQPKIGFLGEIQLNFCVFAINGYNYSVLILNLR